MPSREKLAEFAAWCAHHIVGDEKGEAQIFLDRLFQTIDQPGCLNVGGTTECRIRTGEPVTAPSVPKNYPAAWKLVAEDCLKPTV